MINQQTLSLLQDKRVNCWSLMTTMTINDYTSLIKPAYENRGGLKFQREALKTTSGKRIRGRMVDDITKGAILPPVVLGVVVNDDKMRKVNINAPGDILKSVLDDWKDKLSIIDGMQRTTALFDAIEKDQGIKEQPIRVEFWISESTESLIYRMLVLNTGQVPWNLKRQLQVVYAPLIEEMKQQVGFERLLTLENQGRRTKGGEFSADSIIEAYLAFGLRRTEIDTQEKLADEFSRLDMVEAISSHRYKRFFYPIVQTMLELDLAFSRLDKEPTDSTSDFTNKFSIGRNIFDSQPAVVGFIVAAAIFVLGRLGMERDDSLSQEALEKIIVGKDKLLNKLKDYSDDNLREFLGLGVLSELLMTQKRTAIGRYERSFFETAFKVLIEEGFNVPTMEVCWRAS